MQHASQDQLADIKQLLTPSPTITDDEIVSTDETVSNVDETPVDDTIQATDDDLTTIVDDDDESSTIVPDDAATAAEPFDYTIQQLAEAIEVTGDDMYKVVVPLHGLEQTSISLGEMKDQFISMTKQLAENKTTAVESSNTMNMDIAAQQIEIAGSLKIDAIRDEFNAVDWKDLEEFEPAEAVLTRQRLEDRYNNVQHEMQQASLHQQQQRGVRLQTAWTKTLENIPSWSDPQIMKAEAVEMETAMREAGYPEAQLNQVEDPIAMKLLHELITLRREKVTAKQIVKKVKNPPKVLRPSGKIVESTSKLDTLVAKAKKSGNKHDEFAAVKELLQSAGVKP